MVVFAVMNRLGPLMFVPQDRDQARLVDVPKVTGAVWAATV
jgi:hypothetical protein